MQFPGNSRDFSRSSFFQGFSGFPAVVGQPAPERHQRHRSDDVFIRDGNGISLDPRKDLKASEGYDFLELGSLVRFRNKPLKTFAI